MTSRVRERNAPAPGVAGDGASRGGLRSRLPLVLGAASGLVICAGVLALLMLLTGRSPDPRPAAQALCADLQAQDYSSLYAALAPQVQSVGTQAEFVASQQQLDALSGRVTSCSFAIQSSDRAQAQLSLAITRSRVGPVSGAVHLVSTSGAWKVDSFDASVV